jgi:predicted PurR-regulated permease PerM
MTGTPLPPKRQSTARLTLILLLGLLGLWVIHAFLPVLVWAVVIAVAVDPLVQRAERRFPRPNLVAAAFTLGFALIVLAPIAIGIAQAAREAHDVAIWVKEAQLYGVPPPAWLANLPFSAEATNWWRTNLSDPAAAHHHFETLSHSLLGAQARPLGFGLIHRAVVFGFTLIALFFLIRDRDALAAQFRTASAKLLGPQGERMGQQALASVRGTIDGLVLVGLGFGAVMTAVYVFLGVPHPILLGAVTAIAAMIPFGAPIAFGIAALLLLGQGSPGAAIAVAVIGFAAEFVAGHFVRPVLIGSATRLPFFWALVGILGGVETLGLLGLFVGPATMAVLVMLWRELVESDPTPIA